MRRRGRRRLNCCSRWRKMEGFTVGSNTWMSHLVRFSISASKPTLFLDPTEYMTQPSLHIMLAFADFGDLKSSLEAARQRDFQNVTDPGASACWPRQALACMSSAYSMHSADTAGALRKQNAMHCPLQRAGKLTVEAAGRRRRATCRRHPPPQHAPALGM